MAIGTFGDIVFRVSDQSILTPGGLSVTAGGSWAQHDRIRGKPKTEYTGANLRTASFEILLSADLGVRPRKLLEQLEEMVESGEAYAFVIGGKPIGRNLWRPVSISETWNTVLNRGELVSAKVTLNLEEYV